MPTHRVALTDSHLMHYFHLTPRRFALGLRVATSGRVDLPALPRVIHPERDPW